MGYLKVRHNSRLAFDPSYSDIDDSNFWECNWKDFYEGPMEAIPHDALLPGGNKVYLQMFVDSNHAGDNQTRKSRMMFVIYINML